MTHRPAPALILAALLTSAPSALAGNGARPVAVSPGHASRLLLVGDPCPTFSWGQTPGAHGYELVVYRLAGGEEAPVVLRAAIDGRAGSWTPTMGRCLERGGRYAWSVRARHPEAVSPWSTAAFFEVAAAPSGREMEEALAVLRAWAAERASPAVAEGEEPAATAGSADARQPSGRLENAAGVGRAPEGAPEPGEPGSADPGTADSGTVALSVDGSIEAGSFAGDGGGLTGVAAADLACVGCVATVELADGAVTAAKIGAACAAGQVLMRSGSGWECATIAAPACTSGDQIGCYSGPGGTLGVGECRAGTRFCDEGAWGACAGEIGPAGEACDGLDNSCDGAIDEGDPAALCPPTTNVATTSCDAAACAVASCDPQWADADGDYANGCEAPAPGHCLDGGSPRPIAGPSEGDLVIQELMADPASPLADADAEWFEVAAQANVDLNDLGIGTTFGTVVDEIDAADCLPVEAGDLLLFARSADPAQNGGLAVAHTFGFSLVNGGGELHLAHGGDLVDAVSWSAGDVVSGRARSLPPGLADAASNDDPANWCVVPGDGTPYAENNFGTPGTVNPECP